MLIAFSRKIIHRFEDAQVGLGNYILTFIGAVALRIFLEVFSDLSFPPVIRYVHYCAFYLCLALSLAILFHFATKEKLEKVLRIVLPSFFILVLAPLADLALSGGSGYDSSYLLPGVHQGLFWKFLTFFGRLDEPGVTPGIRVEIGLAILFSFFYFLTKTGKLLRSISFSILMYSLLFFYASMPFATQGIMRFFGAEYVYSDMLMRNIYFSLLFILGTWAFYLYNRAYFVEILKDIRIFRILHFELICVLGYVFSRNPIVMTTGLFWVWIFIFLSIFFACLFSLATNNLADCEIDAVSNKARPLVSQRIKRQDYIVLSWIFLAAALFYSLAAGFVVFFIILLFIGNYFLYSMPPLRLKRIPFFSKLFIALNSLVLFMLGYSLATGKFWVPGAVVVFFLLYFMPSLNFIDIKDYEGDRLHGIRTLPVILGLRQSKFVIGVFFFLTYCAIYSVLPAKGVLFFSAAFGLLMFLLINRKNYREEPVLVAYLSSLVILIIYLLKY